MNFLLGFTQRSGSSWIADLLSQDGFGPVDEFHLADPTLRFSLDWPAAKMQWDAFLQAKTSCPNLSAVPLVFLTRRDRVGQAISFYRADVTQRWSCFSKNPDQAVPYDPERILYWMGILWNHECLWAGAMLRHEAPILHLYYEDFMLNPRECYQLLTRFLGRERLITPETSYVVQRDETTEAWRASLWALAQNDRHLRSVLNRLANLNPA